MLNEFGSRRIPNGKLQMRVALASQRRFPENLFTTNARIWTVENQ